MITCGQGQSALFSGVLFFIILLIVSALLSTSTLRLASNQDFNIEYRQRYAAQTLNALLEATIPKIWYVDNNNNNITLEDKTTLYLILFDLRCRKSGTADIASLKLGIEKELKTLIDSLINENYRYAFVATYSGSRIFISNGAENFSNLPQERVVSAITEPMVNLEGEASISLMIW